MVHTEQSQLTSLLNGLQHRDQRVEDWHRALTAFAATGPRNGGQGEEAKAQYVAAQLRSLGVQDIQFFYAPDPEAPQGTRPNILARIPGKSPRTLWLLTHMDVVPPGELTLWHTDPWCVVREGDVLTGRGVEDNQQGMVSAMLLAAELCEQGITPEFSLGLLFVADEETGNTHGMDYLMREHAALFAPDDMFVVPDFGTPQGDHIEISEKHVLWLKFEIEGRQCHGSTPHKGVNAMLAGSALALRLAELHTLFPQHDALFDPPCSTFTPTKREANVPNVNTVPGRDVLYMDCRILPQLAVQDVLDAVTRTCADIERSYGVRVQVSTESRIDAAPPTPTDSDIVRILTPAIKAVYGVDAKTVGVGASTVACYLRRHGLAAVVWSRLLSNCHAPNEKSLISNNIGDAQVFAHVLFSAL